MVFRYTHTRVGGKKEGEEGDCVPLFSRRLCTIIMIALTFFFFSFRSLLL